MMRTILVFALVFMMFANFANAAMPLAPADWATDDIITLVYDPVAGSLALVGDDTPGADAIRNFELISEMDFLDDTNGDGMISNSDAIWDAGLFDIWNPRRAFRLFPTGFVNLPADGAENMGSAQTGHWNANEFLTLAFGAPDWPRPLGADIAFVPESSSLVLFGFGTLGLFAARRCPQ